MYVAALLDRRERGEITTSYGGIVFVDKRSELSGALEHLGLPAGLPATGGGGASVSHNASGRALPVTVVVLGSTWLGGLLLRRTVHP